MKSIFKVVQQGEAFAVQSQKAEGGQTMKCSIVLQEIGGKYENSFVASLIGSQVKVCPGDIVWAALRFSAREYNGSTYQDITIQEIFTFTRS